MLENLVISENYCNFIVLKYKELQTIIAMITEDKVTELFCIADDFCKFFDAMMEKRESRDRFLILVCLVNFQSSGKGSNSSREQAVNPASLL